MLELGEIEPQTGEGGRGEREQSTILARVWKWLKYEKEIV